MSTRYGSAWYVARITVAVSIVIGLIWTVARARTTTRQMQCDGNVSYGAQNVAATSYQLKTQSIHQGDQGIYPNEVFSSLLELDSFAVRWREQNRGKWFEVETLATFCCLIKRTVFDKIGGTFPEAPLGIAEVELSRAVRSVGYRLASCQDLYIHHSATRTPSRGR